MNICHMHTTRESRLFSPWLFDGTNMFTNRIGAHHVFESAGKQVGTNVTRRLLMEIQYLVPFTCYDSPDVFQRGESINGNDLAKVMSDLFYKVVWLTRFVLRCDAD